MIVEIIVGVIVGIIVIIMVILAMYFWSYVNFFWKVIINMTKRKKVKNISNFDLDIKNGIVSILVLSTNNKARINVKTHILSGSYFIRAIWFKNPQINIEEAKKYFEAKCTKKDSKMDSEKESEIDSEIDSEKTDSDSENSSPELFCPNSDDDKFFVLNLFSEPMEGNTIVMGLPKSPKEINIIDNDSGCIVFEFSKLPDVGETSIYSICNNDEIIDLNKLLLKENIEEFEVFD